MNPSPTPGMRVTAYATTVTGSPTAGLPVFLSGGMAHQWAARLPLTINARRTAVCTAELADTAKLRQTFAESEREQKTCSLHVRGRSETSPETR